MDCDYLKKVHLVITAYSYKLLINRCSCELHETGSSLILKFGLIMFALLTLVPVLVLVLVFSFLLLSPQPPIMLMWMDFGASKDGCVGFLSFLRHYFLFTAEIDSLNA